MASWREGTSKQYHTYLKSWRQYCDDKDINLFQPGVHNGVEFLVSLYKWSWLQCYERNPFCPFLPPCLGKQWKVWRSPFGCSLPEGHFWIIAIPAKIQRNMGCSRCVGLLEGLCFNASSALSLKELSLKLTMLLFLLLASVDKLSISLTFTIYIQDLGDRYRISVHEKLKQTKPSRHLEPIDRTIAFSRGQGTSCGATFEGIYPSNWLFA